MLPTWARQGPHRLSWRSNRQAVQAVKPILPAICLLLALAAIQGLNEKAESGKQKVEIRMANLEAENVDLKQQLTALERLVTALNPKGE